MVKRADPKQIERYKDNILTNPVTYVGNLQEARERLRRTGELACMQEAIAHQQDYPEGEVGDKVKEDNIIQAELGIINVGKQMEWIDEELEIYKETVEVIEQSQQMPPHSRPSPVKVNRKARRTRST